MKAQVVIFCASMILFICGCNNAPTNSAGQQDSVADTTHTEAAPAVVDPDPTDTIPGDRYGINSSSMKTADLVRLTLRDLFKADLEGNFIDSISRKFIFFEYDLNSDGRNEILVGLIGSFFCGSGGCTQFVLDDQGKVITRFTVADYPVVIDTHKTNGWNDLFIHSGSKDRIVRFDGKKYPSNPSVLPALSVLPGDGLPRALNFINEPYPWFTF
jgi:hypothetical protein